MRPQLYRRLRHLEVLDQRARSARESRDRAANSESVIRRIEIFLRICGIERGPMESWFDALARAVQLPPRELRRQMLEGIDPIRRFFSEHGVYEEIESKKAAGTWPGGGGNEARGVRI